MADNRMSFASSAYSGDSKSEQTATIATSIENKRQPDGTEQLLSRTSAEAKKKRQENKAARNKEAESKK
ncbi:hypothetical protein H2202_011141 [Exophiala xenobiotica]|nr:hypothetical protein H2202_011141 [Exophiala xenobiotica]